MSSCLYLLATQNTFEIMWFFSNLIARTYFNQHHYNFIILNPCRRLPPLLGLSSDEHWYIYTGCPRRKGPNVGRVFLRSNCTDITQNTYIQSSMVTEILAREFWKFDSYYSLIDFQIHIETGRNMWFL